MQSYQNIKKLFIGLIFLSVVNNNCFADRDHTRFIRNDSPQDWRVTITFSSGSLNTTKETLPNGEYNYVTHVVGLVTGSGCVQDEECTIKSGETKALIYRVPPFSNMASNYSGTLTIKDSHDKVYIYKIQGQYLHYGPWIYSENENGAPKGVITLNKPDGGDIVINKGFWVN